MTSKKRKKGLLKKDEYKVHPNKRESHAPGDQSTELVNHKTKHGLPLWKSLADELNAIAERRGESFANELKSRVDLYQKYIEFQTVLVSQYKTLGLDALNTFHNAMDLQLKLFELEEKLKAEGVNPIESPEWVKAREMLHKEHQFIHKHGLDTARFQRDLDKYKNKQDDDNLFTVEGSDE